MLSYSLSSLLVFSRVVKQKSFSRAAETLFMTQPGVSNHVAQLEQQTGLSLIKRDKGKFELTKEGRAVYRYALRIEKVARELEDTLHALQKGIRPSLRLGTTITYSRILMPYVLGSFQKRHPDIKIKLDAGSSAEMEKTLFSGQNDVIIIANPHVSRNTQAFPFVREELVLIASNEHPLAKKKAVTLADIRPYPYIIREEGSATRDAVLTAFSKMNIAPSVLIEAKSTEFIKEWVSQGKGVSILIRRAASGEEDKSITIVPLRKPLFMEVSMVYLKSRRYDPAIQKFIAFLRELKI
jgi:DNA-binding transcriptional LysR family regulator